MGLISVGLLAMTGLGYWLINGHSVAVFDTHGIIANKERGLIIFALVLALFVVVPVYALLLGIIWRYREGHKTAKYTPDNDGNRILESIWWLVPTALIVILSVVTWNSSHQLDPYQPLNSSNVSIKIQVISLDWKWLFIYPEQHIASINYLRIPVNTPVEFQITSDAPMNSFWVPQLGGQIYAMPGMSTELHLMANSSGRFHGSSANISGRGFAGMTFIVEATDSLSYQKWLSTVKQTGDQLTIDTYNKLVLPSQDNPIKYYSSVPINLYATILMKYMSMDMNHSLVYGVGN